MAIKTFLGKRQYPFQKNLDSFQKKPDLFPRFDFQVIQTRLGSELRLKNDQLTQTMQGLDWHLHIKDSVKQAEIAQIIKQYKEQDKKNLLLALYLASKNIEHTKNIKHTKIQKCSICKVKLFSHITSAHENCTEQELRKRILMCEDTNSHLFHDNCIYTWILHKGFLSCPICREKMNPINKRSFLLELVQRNGLALQFASDALKNDRELVLAAIRQNVAALRFASINLRNDKTLLLEAVQRSAPNSLNNRELVLAAIQQDGLALRSASVNLRKDRELVLAAIRQNVAALQFASDDLKNDKKFVLEATRQDVATLEFVDLKKDRGFLLEAVQINGLALQFAPDNLKNDRELVLEAIRQNGFALQFASDDLKNDRELVLEAIRKDGWVLNFAADRLKYDETLQKVAWQQMMTGNSYADW